MMTRNLARPAVSLISGVLLASVLLTPAAGAASPSPTPASAHAAEFTAASATKTVLHLDQLKPMIYLAPWEATGSLTATGRSTAGRTVILYGKNYRDSHGSVVYWKVLGHGVTDAHGRFAILAPGLDYPALLYHAEFAGSPGLGSSISAGVTQTITAEKIAITAHAAYGKRTSVTVTLTTVDGKVPKMGHDNDYQNVVIQYRHPTRGWVDVDNERDEYGNPPQTNAHGRVTITGQPSTSAVVYRAQLDWMPADGGHYTKSAPLTVAATRPTTTISAAAVRKGTTGYVAGKFTIGGRITSQSNAQVTHSQSVRIFRQKIGTTTWSLVAHAHTNTKGAWAFSVPTDLTMAYQARLPESAAMHGSASAAVRVIRT